MSEVVKINKARVAYPHLFKKAVFDGQEGKFEITFLIPKDSKQVVRIKKHIAAIRSDLAYKIPNDKVALKDGDDLGREEWAGHYVLKASTNRRPKVINRDKSPIVEDDGIIYGGCFVNATVDFWVQNNQYGKRVNCNLRAVQFDSDGEPFGMGPVDDEEHFDELEDDFDDDAF